MSSLIIAGVVSGALCTGLLICLLLLVLKTGLEDRIRRVYRHVHALVRDTNYGFLGVASEDERINKLQKSSIEALNTFNDTLKRTQSALGVISKLLGISEVSACLES
jgi:hypothetical protein